MAAISAASVCAVSLGSISSSCRSLSGHALTAGSLPPLRRVSPRGPVVSCSSAPANEPPVHTRRFALSLLAAAAAVSTRVNPADAAYGDAANVFGAVKKSSGFTPYAGEGFSLDVPAKWNPSKEVEFPGQVVRYEDNFDATSNLSVSIVKTDKSSVKDYGSPEKLLESFSYLLGKQSYSGETDSEGGFSTNEVVTAAVLESEVNEVNGKTYFKISVLTRTADGDEGGKHHLISATVDDGKLFIAKAQAGDKRWFKGAQKFVERAVNSFQVA